MLHITGLHCTHGQPYSCATVPQLISDGGHAMCLHAERMMEVFNINTIGPLVTVQTLVNAGLLGPPGSIVGTLTSKASLYVLIIIHGIVRSL